MVDESRLKETTKEIVNLLAEKGSTHEEAKQALIMAGFLISESSIVVKVCEEPEAEAL